jgi:hypothetical protein
VGKREKYQIQRSLECLEQAEEMGDMNVYQMEEKVSLLYENLKMLDDEEICWKQRSHEN